ncbi:MAG: type II secretion system minor pseudopilin GspI [Chromatiales bacterium]|nr:type II secretion system minor pseudopilin GspI [Chromatiales bacterium]
MVDRPQPQRGFTLIEVLVALAIVSLGLIAIFAQLNQSLLTTSLLRDRTLAHWVAADRLTELRLSGDWPAVGQRSDEIEFGPYRWRYTLRISETPGADLRRIDVSVALSSEPARPMATLVGFLSEPPPSPVVSAEGWFLLDPNRPMDGPPATGNGDED